MPPWCRKHPIAAGLAELTDLKDDGRSGLKRESANEAVCLRPYRRNNKWRQFWSGILTRGRVRNLRLGAVQDHRLVQFTRQTKPSRLECLFTARVPRCHSG